MKCKYCKKDLPEKNFTKFDRNPVLSRERNGYVYVCRECANNYVHEKDDTKEALREILKEQDIPYLENYAEQAYKNYKKKLKKTNVVIKQNLYNGKVTKGKETVNIQTSIYTCYCSRLGVIPKTYYNYSFSDGIRDLDLEEKLKNMEKMLKTDEDCLEVRAIKNAKNYVKKMFNSDVLDDLDSFYGLLHLKIQEMNIQSNNQRMRNKKHLLKKHIQTLVDNGELDEKFIDLFETKNIEKEEELVVRNNDYNMEELRKKWVGFKDEEIVLFEDKYQDMSANFEPATKLHDEFLKLACISAVKGSLAMAKGDSADAKKYMDMFKDLSGAGKLQPKQLSKADMAGGMVNFSDLFSAIEEAMGIVDVQKIIPQLQKQPQDDVDIIIWCVIQYCRRLKGLPDCKYQDIWGFYDEMVKQANEELDILEGDIDGEEL